MPERTWRYLKIEDIGSLCFIGVRDDNCLWFPEEIPAVIAELQALSAELLERAAKAKEGGEDA